MNNRQDPPLIPPSRAVVLRQFLSGHLSAAERQAARGHLPRLNAAALDAMNRQRASSLGVEQRRSGAAMRVAAPLQHKQMMQQAVSLARNTAARAAPPPEKGRSHER